MLDINSLIANELGLKTWQIENALALREEGGTLPFIARYRKEKTGELTETHLRDLFDRNDYLKELEERKLAILESIDSQGKLTGALRKQIEECMQKNILEDLYLPYKPKKRTKATIAREKGLEPLAISIKEANLNNTALNLKSEAEKYINDELEVKSIIEALSGASDILAEELSEVVDLRNWVREFIGKNGIFVTKIKPEFEVGSTKFEMYRDFQVQISKVAPHQMLAMRRAEGEKILSIDLKFEEDDILNFIEKKQIISNQIDIVDFYAKMIKDSYTRLFKNSLIGELRLDRKVIADIESVKVFENNVRQMLLSAPAGMKPTMGIDPGFRTGCKVCALDNTGKY
ncbi:MAG: RNA-binding transcriptional accessory protein, partial [Candidatus Kapabacteria bacterium]|nr:RNA-binding transcriptional accessory protein [Candidatus Kapabacteria bacterium]